MMKRNHKICEMFLVDCV